MLAKEAYHFPRTYNKKYLPNRVGLNVLWLLLMLFELSLSELSYTAEIQKPFEERNKITTYEKVINFSIVYAAQWSVYLIDQYDTVKKYGSFENWYENPFKPHFDKDNLDYNLINHTWVGQYYYLFYRSRGYQEQASLVWSFISSFAFEFTIETATQQPSIQDCFQTPVFGAVLGYGTEKLSHFFLGFDTTTGDILAFLFNPFLILPPKLHSIFTVSPIDDGAVVVGLWSF